jgi:DNA-binding transcriptional LysR family regulator
MSYQLEIRHLNYFMAVAEELNYRKAAEKLFISQPGLSRQISQMEALLGVQLFERTKRKVELTAAGEYLRHEAHFLINHINRTQVELQRIHAGTQGEINIGFIGSAMQQVIPELMVKMNAHFPETKVSLEEMSNGSQVEKMEKGELDFGFVRLARVPAGFHMHPVLEDTFSVVLPKDHILNEQNFKGVEQLAKEHFILFSSDYSPLYYDMIMSICEDKGFSPNVSHKSVHAPTIFKLVERGLGVAIIPSALQYGFDLDVKFIELKNIPQRTTLSVIWKKANRNPAMWKAKELWFGEG